MFGTKIATAIFIKKMPLSDNEKAFVSYMGSV